MTQKKTMETKDLFGFENVVDAGEKLKAYFEENARQIIAIALLICLAAGAVSYWVISSKAAAQTAQNLLNRALTTMSAPAPPGQEQSDSLSEAAATLSEVIEGYSRTEAGRLALFYRAQCKKSQKDYDAAITDYTAFLQYSGPLLEELKPFALENIGYAHEARGKFEEALEWFEKSVQAGRVEALISMARMYEATGSPVRACEHYQKYIELQTESSSRDFVEMKIGDVCRSE